MFYSNKSSILVSGEGNSSRSKMTSFMRILNLQRIVFLMCIVSSLEITWGTKEDETMMKKKIDKAMRKKKIEVTKPKNVNLAKIDSAYKVGFLGDTQVGKTQIINRHVKGSFEEEYKSTVMVEFSTNHYQSTSDRGNSKTIQLNLWDTAGQEKYKTVSPLYMKDAWAIVLVYDVTNAESFNEIKENWLTQTKEQAPENAVYFLVGNKTNLKDKRQVSEEVAKKYAENNNMQFFEVSIKDKNSIDELFEDIVKECLIKEEDIKEEVIKEEVIRNDIKDYKQENKKNIQSPTHTNNKPCICCSCCPCNK